MLSAAILSQIFHILSNIKWKINEYLRCIKIRAVKMREFKYCANYKLREKVRNLPPWGQKKSFFLRIRAPYSIPLTNQKYFWSFTYIFWSSILQNDRSHNMRWKQSQSLVISNSYFSNLICVGSMWLLTEVKGRRF